MRREEEGGEGRRERGGGEREGGGGGGREDYKPVIFMLNIDKHQLQEICLCPNRYFTSQVQEFSHVIEGKGSLELHTV